MAKRLKRRFWAARTAWPAMRNTCVASSESPTPISISRRLCSPLGSCRRVNSPGLPCTSPDSRIAATRSSTAWPSEGPLASGQASASVSNPGNGPSYKRIFIKRTHHPGPTPRCKAGRSSARHRASATASWSANICTAFVIVSSWTRFAVLGFLSAHHPLLNWLPERQGRPHSKTLAPHSGGLAKRHLAGSLRRVLRS